MEWLEQNIDAYRIVSEILGELRLTVRQRLEQIHGEEWYRKGLPEEVFKRLVAAKEREKSIDWSRSLVDTTAVSSSALRTALFPRRRSATSRRC